MAVETLRAEVATLITKVDNEELLELIKAEILIHGAMGEGEDVTDGLSAGEFDELSMLASEPDTKDVLSWATLSEKLAAWRSK